MADEGDLRSRARHRLRVGLILAAAGLGVLGGRALVSVTPPLPLSWIAYVGRFVGGPHSTAKNDGYGPPADAGSIPVESYVASVRPQTVGVQFIGASALELRRQHLTMTMRAAGAKGVPVPVLVTRNGFAGYRVPARLKPGRYTFEIGSPTLGYTPSWTVTLDPTLRLRPPGRQGEEARAVLNQVRAALGLKPAGWSRALALAAGYHARYVAYYGYNRPSFHLEERGPLYFGVHPWDRDLRAGYRDASTGEVGIFASHPIPGPLFVGALFDTVYHRLGLLDGNLSAVGMASAAGIAGGATMMDLGYVYRPDLPLAIAYPPPGAAGVATSWYDNEQPDPVPNGQGGLYGYPVTIDFPTVNRLGAVAMALLHDGRIVPAYVDRPGVGDMAWNQAGLVPTRPLQPTTTYDVVMVARRALFNDGHTRSMTERWSFTTGAGDESVYTGVYDRTLYVVVDTPGAFPPGEAARVHVTWRRGPRRRSMWVRVGASGVGAVPAPRLAPGLWIIESVTVTGNRGVSLYEAP